MTLPHYHFLYIQNVLTPPHSIVKEYWVQISFLYHRTLTSKSITNVSLKKKVLYKYHDVFIPQKTTQKVRSRNMYYICIYMG